MNRTRLAQMTVAGMLALATSIAARAATATPADDGLVAVKSAYTVGETG
jgi:hypothetical protein